MSAHDKEVWYFHEGCNGKPHSMEELKAHYPDNRFFCFHYDCRKENVYFTSEQDCNNHINERQRIGYEALRIPFLIEHDPPANHQFQAQSATMQVNATNMQPQNRLTGALGAPLWPGERRNIGFTAINVGRRTLLPDGPRSNRIAKSGGRPQTRPRVLPLPIARRSIANFSIAAPHPQPPNDAPADVWRQWFFDTWPKERKTDEEKSKSTRKSRSDCYYNCREPGCDEKFATLGGAINHMIAKHPTRYPRLKEAGGVNKRVDGLDPRETCGIDGCTTTTGQSGSS